MGQLMIHSINKYKINETIVDELECVHWLWALRVTITITITITITLVNKYESQSNRI